MSAEAKVYVCQFGYTSSYGILTEGKEYSLDDEEAEMFNRDSPGVLTLKKPEKKAPVKPPPKQDRGSPKRATKKPAAKTR